MIPDGNVRPVGRLPNERWPESSVGLGRIVRTSRIRNKTVSSLLKVGSDAFGVAGPLLEIVSHLGGDRPTSQVNLRGLHPTSTMDLIGSLQLVIVEWTPWIQSLGRKVVDLW